MSPLPPIALRGLRVCAALLLAWMASLSPDLAHASAGRPHVLWSAAGHAGSVDALVLSPDGTQFATAGSDGTVKLWRYPQGTLIRTLVVAFDLDRQVTAMTGVRFTPDGAHLVAATQQYDADTMRDFGAVHVFRVADGTHERVFGRQADGISAIDLSPDGRWLAAAGGEGVTIWRFADGTRLQTLAGHPGPATAVRFSPTGDRVCAGFEDHGVAQWRTHGWSLSWNLAGAHDDRVTQAAYAPAGDLVATASWDGTAKTFSAADGALVHTLDAGSGQLALAFAADGAALVTGGVDGRIRAWDVAQGTLIRRFADSAGEIASLAYADGGSALLSGGALPARIAQWNPADGSMVRRVTRLSSGVRKVVVSTDSTRIALAAPDDDRVDVLRASDGRWLYAWNTQTEADEVALSPDGRLAAMAGAGNTVVIRRLSDGGVERTLAGHEERVVGVAFSHDGTLLASGSFFPGSIRIWRMSDGALIRVVQGGSQLGAFGPFASLNFSPDDRLLGASAEGSPIVLRVADGSVAARPAGLSLSVGFSPDGRLFAVAGGVDQDEVRLYDTGDWHLAQALPVGANDVAFSADGACLLAAQLDALRLWRTADWTVAATYDRELGYTGFGGGVQAVALSPDGHRLAYGRDDATLVVARDPCGP